MSDEAMGAITNLKRDYTMKTYCYLRNSLISKAKELGGDWNAELVGRALWARAMSPKTINERIETDRESSYNEPNVKFEGTKAKKRKI